MTTEETKQDETDALATLVETAKSTRLTAGQEAEAAQLITTSLLGAKARIAASVESMLNLPWSIGVHSTTAAWPEMKPAARKNFLAFLAASQTEQGRRLRLSLGRGLLTLDQGVALKLIHGVCVEMTAAQDETTMQKDRQIFSNVLIGKDKPWILHLPLGQLNSTEAGDIVQCAIAACFSGSCPPLTQLFLIRWIASSGKLETLPEPCVLSIAKSVRRWHPKLQSQLRTDIPILPPSIEQALNKPAPVQPQTSKPDHSDGAGNNRMQEKQGSEVSPRDGKGRQPAPGRQSQAGFDLGLTLRQIETHVHSLRAELKQAKSETPRDREPSRPRGRDSRRSPGLSAGPTDPLEIEELKRHNGQLEETVAELRRQLEDLAANHEDIATSMGAHDEIPLSGEREQFKALLGIKLRDDYAEFEKLAKEPADEVFREHYRMLLESVFSLLENQGIVLKAS